MIDVRHLKFIHIHFKHTRGVIAYISRETYTKCIVLYYKNTNILRTSKSESSWKSQAIAITTNGLQFKLHHIPSGHWPQAHRLIRYLLILPVMYHIHLQWKFQNDFLNLPNCWYTYFNFTRNIFHRYLQLLCG